jgi:uncharacterized protein YqcC (DUF446 family)
MEEVEGALRADGAWDVERPSAEAITAGEPFGGSSMAFEQWLRHVFVDRVQSAVTGVGELPGSSSVGTQAHREWVMWGEATPEQLRLIELLQSLDAVVSFHPRLARLGFFETARGGTSGAGRELFDELLASTTRSIGWQVELAFEPPVRSVPVAVASTLTGPHEKLPYSIEEPLVVAPDWSTCFSFGFWGFAEPGRIPPGSYRVEVTLWDEPLGERTLVVCE